MNPLFKQGDIGGYPIQSIGELNRDEIRQKSRNEISRSRYNQPEQYGRDFVQAQIPGAQFSKLDYYHNQAVPQNFNNSYGYGIQRNANYP